VAARVGMVTIGQSPRDDVVPEIQTMLQSGIDVLQCGALDGLSLEEVNKYAPTPGDSVLVTRMRNGEEVTVGESKILPRIQQCVNKLAAQCDVLAMLCTGQFPQLESEKMILMPDMLLNGIVNAIRGVRTIGVLIPSPAQKAQALERWKKPNRVVAVESASPYSKQDAATPAALKLAASKPDLIVLDCMGYTLRTREVVKKVSGKPVILARSVLARSITEILG
jgi:protein AroM